MFWRNRSTYSWLFPQDKFLWIIITSKWIHILLPVVQIIKTNRKGIIFTTTSRTWSCLFSYIPDNTRYQIFNLHQYYEQRKVPQFSSSNWALLKEELPLHAVYIMLLSRKCPGAVVQAGKIFSVRAWRRRRLFSLKGL